MPICAVVEMSDAEYSTNRICREKSEIPGTECQVLRIRIRSRPEWVIWYAAWRVCLEPCGWMPVRGCSFPSPV